MPASRYKASRTAIAVKLGSGTVYVDERLGFVHRIVLTPVAVSEHPKLKVSGRKSKQGRQDWVLNDQWMCSEYQITLRSKGC